LTMVKKTTKQSVSEEFISIFNEVDSHLRKLAGMGDTVSHMFVVDRLGETNKFIRNHRDELKLYARLRNAIVHNPFGSEIDVIAEPHPRIVAKYAALRDGIVNPPAALRFAIQPKKIYSTTMDASAREVMRVMADKVYTYVPVLDSKGDITGIFSENTVFLYLARNEICAVDSKTAIAEFAEYLPLNQHASEYFEFVSRQANIDDVRDLFEKGSAERKRLAAVFITASGRKDEPILGMLTAWDIAGNNDK
jgi:hypothetical protein